MPGIDAVAFAKAVLDDLPEAPTPIKSDILSVQAMQFPIIRRTFPSSAYGSPGANIPVEYPMQGPPMIRITRLELGIVGGHFHSFIEGWGFNPYKLELALVSLTQPKNRKDRRGIHFVFRKVKFSYRWELSPSLRKAIEVYKDLKVRARRGWFITLAHLEGRK